MDSLSKKPATVDEYIAGYEEEARKRLEAMRQTIRNAAPDAEEVISYGMPAYLYKGDRFIYFAGNKNHIGIYPMPSPSDPAFAQRLEAYKGAKSSLHFPHNKLLPLELLTEIVNYHVTRISAKK